MTDITKKKWLLVSEVEDHTNIPVETIRRYIRNHGHYLQIKKKGKSYLVANESLMTIRRIRELYDKGKKAEDIEDALRSMNIPMAIDVTDKEREIMINASEVLIQLRNDMNEQKQFNQNLLDTLHKQQEYIDHKLKERDQKLMEVLRDIQESKKEIAATEQKKWWEFWK